MKDNVLAIVPARGGSKAIPKKNIKKLNGKRLIEYTAEQIKACSFISRSIVSTDDEDIATISSKIGLEVPFLRPSQLAKDNTPSLPVIQHAVETLNSLDGYLPDIIVLLQPTSPFRKAEQIDEAIRTLQNSDADSIVSVQKVPHSMNPNSVMRLTPEGLLESFSDQKQEITIRQQKPKFYARNGAAIYAFTTECLLKKNSFFGDKTLPFLMQTLESWDLDDLEDWHICEQLLRHNIVHV